MSKVLVSSDGPVRTITLNRSDKRNALDPEMLEGLHAAFSADPPADERVVVLRAEGPVFCAGLDLRRRGQATGPTSSIETMLRAIELYPLPVVARVQGDAIAGGNELALHCDFVIAATSARFGMSLAQIGLVPTWFLTKKLMEVAGPVASREILLLGDPLPARRLHDLGIIGRVVPDGELDTAVDAVVGRLSRNAPLSLKAMKALIVREMAFRDQIAHDDINEQIAAVRDSADAKEGILARLEKREPNFVGR